MAESLAEYIANAAKRDLEYRDHCNVCGRPLQPGEPLGPYLVQNESKPTETPPEGGVTEQKP